MDPQAYQQLIDRMTRQASHNLESFFDSHGLGEVYRAPDSGPGRRKRINSALDAARNQGTHEAVLADALRQYGQETAAGEGFWQNDQWISTGEGPWPPVQIRWHLERLNGDLRVWKAPRRLREAQSYVTRLNELLDHLRANGVPVPDNFELTAADRTTLPVNEGSVEGVHDDAYERLRRFVGLLFPLVPAGPAVGPGIDERLTQLHPRIQEASAQLYLDGQQGSAILEAFKAVNNRVKELAGPAAQGKDGEGLMGHAFNADAPVLRLNAGASTSDRNEQEGYALIFMGAMQGIRNLKAHDLTTPIDPNRAFEYLAFASLLMRRLDDIK